VGRWPAPGPSLWQLRPHDERFHASQTPFYAFNAIDIGRRKAAIEIIASKKEREAASGLVRICGAQRSGEPLPELARPPNARAWARRVAL